MPRADRCSVQNSVTTTAMLRMPVPNIRAIVPTRMRLPIPNARTRTRLQRHEIENSSETTVAVLQTLDGGVW